MLSPLLRRLTLLLAILYAALGLILFLAPVWSAANFSWKISSFVAMTMGGWCFGNAYHAWESARIGRWSIVYPSLIYLWVFGILELLVLFLFRELLILNVPLAWPYILTLGLTVVATIAGIVTWLRERPSLTQVGLAVPLWIRPVIIFFVVFVGLLALLGGRAQSGGLSTEGGIFPQPLTLFTVRAFAAFYAALAFSALPLIWTRNLAPWLLYVRAGLGLLIPILLAALLHLDQFDFANRPGGLLYIGAYVAALVVAIFILAVYRRQPVNYAEATG